MPICAARLVFCDGEMWTRHSHRLYREELRDFPRLILLLFPALECLQLHNSGLSSSCNEIAPEKIRFSILLDQAATRIERVSRVSRRSAAHKLDLPASPPLRTVFSSYLLCANCSLLHHSSSLLCLRARRVASCSPETDCCVLSLREDSYWRAPFCASITLLIG